MFRAMLGDVLVFLRKRLDGYLSTRLGVLPGEPDQPRVVLPDGEKSDAAEFQLGAVTALLVNLELDKVQRQPDLFRQPQANGAVARVNPEIRLNLYILFVARFKQYEQGLSYLSLIIQYFQSHRVLDRSNAPELDSRISRLTVELMTLSFAEQGEIWNSLRSGYLPSLLYRVGMIVFQDEEAIGAPAITEESIITSS